MLGGSGASPISARLAGARSDCGLSPLLATEGADEGVIQEAGMGVISGCVEAQTDQLGRMVLGEGPHKADEALVAERFTVEWAGLGHAVGVDDKEVGRSKVVAALVKFCGCEVKAGATGNWTVSTATTLVTDPLPLATMTE